MQPVFSNSKRRTGRLSARGALVVLAAGLLVSLVGCEGTVPGPMEEPLTSSEAELVDGYNLVVSRVSPLTVATSSSVVFSATLTNTGTLATPSGVIHGVSFWVDGTQVSWSDSHTSSIPPGGSVTLTANYGPAGTRVWTAPSIEGAYSLVARVDDLNRLPNETDELDNDFTSTLTVANPNYDLIVTGVSPTTVSPGGSVVFSATIKNTGTVATPAGAIHGVSFVVNGKQVSWSDTYTTSIPAGASVTVTANSGPAGTNVWQAPTTVGTNTVAATVDDIDRLPNEMNEDDNRYSTMVTVGAPPPGYNLVVTKVSPSSVAGGSSVIFNATIQNTGTTETPSGIIHGVSFYVNGTQVSWSDDSTDSIPAGGSVQVTANGGPAGTNAWTAPTTAGTHTLAARVDDINRLPAETNETDNVYSTQVSVSANATCSDRVQNGTETGVDCGPGCGPCEWPFTAVSRATLRQSTKKVYAHWHYYPVSLENYNPTTNDYYQRNYIAVGGEGGAHTAYGGMMRERPLPRLTRTETDWRIQDAKDEIQLAARIGIDGFYLNLWTDSDTNNGGLWTRVKAVVDAASQLGGFDIVPNFDMTILNTGTATGDQDRIIRILGKLKASSALLRRPDGKYVVGMFFPNAHGRTASFYSTVKQRASAELGMSLYLVPVFLGTGSTTFFEEYKTVGDAYAGWGTAVPITTAGYSGSLKTKAAGYGKPWIHPISSQDYRPKDKAFWEAKNSQTLRSIWENVIADGLEQVQIVTWNDQHEHHAIRPSTGKQWPAYDMTAYYIQWFKTGVKPTIERDVLYYNHRIHNQSLVPTKQTSTNLAVCKAGCPATNDVELVGFLKSAGRLEITQGTTTYGEDEIAGGVQVIKTPMAVGTPTFRLKRGGVTLVQFKSMHNIVGTTEYQDLLYRAGSSSRAALPSCTNSCTIGEARCHLCPGEPMWLKR